MFFHTLKDQKLGGNEINLVDYIGRQFMGDGSWWGLEQIADDFSFFKINPELEDDMDDDGDGIPDHADRDRDSDGDGVADVGT